MFRLCAIALCLALLAPLAASRADEARARHARPPTEYNGRVQMYELPARVAPPKLPDLPSDPRKTSGREMDSIPGATPKNALTLIPPPSAPGGDASSDRESLGRRRDSLSDILRGSDSKTIAPSSWGWLADDIATNRAQRSTQSSFSSRDDEDNDAHSASSGSAESNQTSRAGGAQKNGEQGERPDGATQTASIAPVLGSFGDASSNSPNGENDIFAAPTLDVRNAPSDSAANRSTVDADRYAIWSPIAPASSGSSLFGGGNDSAIERLAAQPAREETEPARATPVDARFADPGRFTPAESVSMFSGSAFSDAGNSFQPFEVKPIEASPLSIPASQTPLPISSATSYSAPVTPSLGGMGTERERARATPKTLPW